MVILEKVCWPISALLISSTSFIHNKVKQKKHNISVDELSDVLNLTSDEGLGEDPMLKGIVRFGSTDVKQIMKSRLDVTAIDIKTDYKDLFKIILECGYSRIPVYKKNFDHIAGVLYTKDLLPGIELVSNQEAAPASPTSVTGQAGETNQITGPAKPSSPWQNLIRSPFFVPENKKLDDLLREFQEKKIHLAIVVDEYGGTSGIVTLEDVIEEIVGEISDEYDNEEISYSKLDDSNYVFNGNTPLNDLYRILNIDGAVFENVKGESDTLAGFIIEMKGRIPHKNEKTNFANFSFTVEAVDKRRINRIKVTVSEPDDFKEMADNYL